MTGLWVSLSEHTHVIVNSELCIYQGGTVVSLYVGMARKQDRGQMANQSISNYMPINWLERVLHIFNHLLVQT